MTEPLNLRVVMGSSERRGAWTVPAQVNARVMWGNLELDLREAELGTETTIDARVTMGNLEIIVPADLAVDVRVDSIAGNVEQGARDGGLGASVEKPEPGAPVTAGVYRDPAQPPTRRLHVTGTVRFGNCEIIPLRDGETRLDHARRIREIHRLRHGHHRHHHRHERWRELHAERELWRAEPGRSPWLPWWLQAQMRRRIFSWFAIAFVLGVLSGVHYWPAHHWWHFLIAALVLSIISGAVSWRLTRPLIAVVKAARDIGDGKLDTRIRARGRGEMHVLATAINDMASRIEQQVKDQRQLLAAVSHELRTPLGHMRVLIETARDAHDPKALAELDREVLTLDDLVGRLLASSRLEFGNLDKRTIDLGELVSDLATQAGVAPEQIEAEGDVRAAVDPTLVRRAIANLLDNARTHGGGAVAVRVVRRGAQVAIEVDDAGPGVTPDRRADAFRAFVPSSGGGLGLGLALVSRIAVAHEGGAWIADRPGGGARVGFTVGA
jgi:signal transduction histidine kinase